MFIKSKIVAIIATVTMVTTGCSNSSEDASSLPAGQIEHIIPVAAGGGTDLTHRGLTDVVQSQLDRDAIVTNVEGAGGSVGFTQAASSPADGLHLSSYTSEIFTLPILQDDVGFKPDDFQPLVLISEEPAALVVGSDAPYDTIDEFLTAAKKHPGAISVGNSGTGNIWHLSASQLEATADVEFKHVSYNGASETVQATLGGHIDSFIASVPEVASQVEAGKLKVLGVMGEEPVEPLTDVPTFKDSGVDIVMGTWRGLGLPSDVDEETVDELEDIYTEAIGSEEFKTFMSDNDMNINFMGVEEFQDFVDQERPRYEKLAKEVAKG
jgi:tripartite-type tricarboxylate transporter receptor subunit TctC